MTQAVNNNILNNLEQMIASTSNISKPAEKIVSGIDKSTNFKNVLETKLDKEPSSIADMKSEKDVPVALADFKELLKQVTNEANVETSLDLTLARDITEIISQLKNSIEKTTETIEEPEEDIQIEELLSTEESELLEADSTIDLTIDSEKNTKQIEQKVPFEQLLAFADKTINTKLDLEQIKNFVEKESTNLTESVQEITNEIIEFTENVAKEVVSVKQTVDETINSELESILDEEMLKDLNIESMSAETDSAGGETLMQNQTPEEYAVKAMMHVEPESFEVKLESTQSIQNTQQAQTKPVEITADKLVDQISKHIENLHNGSKVNIVLNPESLGKVSIQLLSTKEGLTAQFTVTTQEAKDLLTKGLDGLKDTLAAQGIGVENVSVKIAEGEKTAYNQDWTDQEGSRGGNKKQQQPNKEEKNKELFEKMMAQSADDENGNV